MCLSPQDLLAEALHVENHCLQEFDQQKVVLKSACEPAAGPVHASTRCWMTLDETCNLSETF